MCVVSLTTPQDPGIPWSHPLSSPEAQKLTPVKRLSVAVFYSEFFHDSSSLLLFVLFCSLLDERKGKDRGEGK